MERYPQYKASGIFWIGEIPVGWKVMRLKYVAAINNSNVDKKTYEGEQPVRLCNYVDVYYNHMITPDMNLMRATATESEIEKFQLHTGDVIITKDSEDWNDIAIPAYVESCTDEMVCGYHLALIRSHPAYLNGKYLFYAFIAEDLHDQFKLSSGGVTRFGLPKSAVNNALFLLPPLPEQQTIASFLDYKASLIETFILKKERQIKLLKEQRVAIINQAVTKGLDPSVPMKDSGIEWIGEIPEHWQTIKIKYIYKLSNAKAPENNDFELLSLYTDIGVRPRKDLEAKGNKASTTDGYWIVEKGDIVVNKLLAWMGAIAFSNYNGVTSPAYDVLKQIKDLNGLYFHYLWRRSSYLTEFKRRSRGIMEMRLRLYFDELGQVLVPFPPANEQDGIVHHIQHVIKKTDSYIAKNQELIEKLKEYRTTLISDAVTGKIDVRAYQLKHTEENIVTVN